ncbi:MAG: hypothetical protein ACYDAY_02840 [Candidatus Dormibacteria bacterium]
MASWHDALTQGPWWVAAIVVVIAGAGYVFRTYFGASVGKSHAAELQLGELKRSLYLRFFTEYWVPLTSGELEGDGMAFLRNWGAEMVLVGSDEVVRSFQTMQHGAAKGDPSPNALSRGADLWLAMRRDMGHVNTRLGKREMLRSIVNASEWDQVEGIIKGSTQLTTPPEVSK